MLGAACVESVEGLHCGEEQNVPDGGGIGQEHDDPVDAETNAAGRKNAGSAYPLFPQTRYHKSCGRLIFSFFYWHRSF